MKTIKKSEADLENRRAREEINKKISRTATRKQTKEENTLYIISTGTDLEQDWPTTML